MSEGPNRGRLLALSALPVLALTARLLASDLDLYRFEVLYFIPIRIWDPNLADSTQFFESAARWLRVSVVSGGWAPFLLALLLSQVPRRAGTARKISYYWLGALLLGLLLALTRNYALGPDTSSTDERAYRFEADLILQGRLQAPTPPFADAFQSYCIYCRDYWTSTYQPGWSLSLAVAKAIGWESCANAVWWVVIVLFLRRLGELLYGKRAGQAASLLFALSPSFWYAAWGDFPHLQTAALTLISWDCFLRFLDSPQQRSAAGCILAWIGVASTRIHDFPLAMMAPLVWTLTEQNPDRKKLLQRGFALMFGGGLAALVAVALQNHFQTGAAWKIPNVLLLADSYQYNTHHSLWRAAFILLTNLVRILWWMPPVLVGALCLRKPRGRDWGLVATTVPQLLVYGSFFQNAGGEWGARYYVVILTAACLPAGAVLAELALARAAWSILLLWTLVQNGQILALCKADYLRATALKAEVRRRTASIPSLVFFRAIPPGWDADTMIYNAPDFASPVEALWLEPEQNAEIVRRFPQHTIWTVDVKDNVVKMERFSPEHLLDSESYLVGGVNRLLIYHEPARALESLERSLPGKNPARTLTLMGVLLRDLGRKPEAIARFQEALRANPSFTQAQSELNKMP